MNTQQQHSIYSVRTVTWCMFLAICLSVLPAEVWAQIQSGGGNSQGSPFEGVGTQSRDLATGFVDWLGPIIFAISLIWVILTWIMGNGNLRQTVIILIGGMALASVFTFADWVFSNSIP